MKADMAGLFDRSAATYDRIGVEFFGPMGRELVRRAGLRPGQSVLDVGCGRGAVLFPAAEAVGTTGSVIGIDLAPAMVELTRADAAAAGLGHVRVEVADAQTPPLPEATFDAVLAGLVVFLLPAPIDALRGYRRLLRPGGRLGFTTFAAHDPLFTETMRTLAQHLPEEQRQSPTAGQEDLFATRKSTMTLLETTGYQDIAVDEATFRSRFRDVEHWMTWAWSHGARGLLERIPTDRLPAALADATRVLKTAGEELTLTTIVRFAFGVRA
ncbi:methyltransferase family protein [Micromonospora pisi]|uniref:Methyltransferase family protein n=1 Tax=Micromonospora pisi TaxID=589240 RepID=A0A495JIY7_9ACTN|nr:methyltransferase domain-containing protein [Micromonospora pisi]RKR88354.1 methyltransferase family protein [Micromonospora pisi]